MVNRNGAAPSADPAAGLATFETVRRVFQHPRCQNCHIPGDAPLQYGRGAAGLPCSTCHATRNPPANPARVYGGLVAVNGLLIALFEMGTVERLGRFRRLRVAALGMVLTGIGFGLTGMVMHWAWFLLTVVLWTFGEILSAPFKMAFVTDWAPPDRRGRYLSWHGATWGLAIGLNPLLFLPLHATLGDRAYWPLMLLIALLIALPMAWVLLRLDRVADRPERLRGLSGDPAPAFPPTVGLGSEVV